MPKRVHKFAYVKDLGGLFKIRGIQSYFASVLKFLVQPSHPHHFEVQTYNQSICHMIYFIVYQKDFLSISQYFNKIAFQ